MANSFPTLPFKGLNIVDLDLMYKQLFDGQHHIILDTISKRKIDRSYKHFKPQFAELQYCSHGENSIYDVNAKCAEDTYSKFLLRVYLRVRIILCKLILFLSELDIY